jgi:hypothetical protein
MPKGGLWSDLFVDVAFERSLWRATERKRRIFGCNVDERLLDEASGNGC